MEVVEGHVVSVTAEDDQLLVKQVLGVAVPRSWPSWGDVEVVIRHCVVSSEGAWGVLAFGTTTASGWAVSSVGSLLEGVVEETSLSWSDLFGVRFERGAWAFDKERRFHFKGNRGQKLYFNFLLIFLFFLFLKDWQSWRFILFGGCVIEANYTWLFGTEVLCSVGHRAEVFVNSCLLSWYSSSIIIIISLDLRLRWSCYVIIRIIFRHHLVRNLILFLLSISGYLLISRCFFETLSWLYRHTNFQLNIYKILI